MTNQNQISVEIPKAVIDTVTEKLQECRAALAPYLQGLTLEERMSLFKIDDKTVATVQKGEIVYGNESRIHPCLHESGEFIKDEKLVSELSPIVNLAQRNSPAIPKTL